MMYENLSKALRDKWASGTRKPNPEGYGKKGGKTRKRMMMEGIMRKRVTTPEQAREYRSKYDREKMLEVNARIGKARIGIPNEGERNSADENNWGAKYWKIKNVSLGVVLEGVNLNKLIKDNAHLFNKEDLQWKKCRCRASKGLRGLFEIRKSTGKPNAYSWKGWVVV